MITTSYFGNREKPKGSLVAITRNTHSAISEKYEVISAFAPSVELLNDYKNKSISWQDYK